MCEGTRVPFYHTIIAIEYIYISYISYKIEENKGETWKHRNHKLYITNIVATNTVTNDCNS